MAKVAKNVSWKQKSRCKFPWDEWLNGEAWEISGKELKQTSLHNFSLYAYLAARKRKKTVRTKIDGNKIFLQAYTKQSTHQRKA